MPLSHVITVHIDVPVERVCDYLGEPRNFAEWTLSDPSKFFQLENGDWSAEFDYSGIRHVRFSPPNKHGIFDIAVFVPGQEPVWMAMRALAEGNGTRVNYTLVQRPGMSEDSFRSAIEWLTVDFLTLKTVLEGRFPSSTPTG